MSDDIFVLCRFITQLKLEQSRITDEELLRSVNKQLLIAYDKLYEIIDKYYIKE